jgi:hypothetical protein
MIWDSFFFHHQKISFNKFDKDLCFIKKQKKKSMKSKDKFSQESDGKDDYKSSDEAKWIFLDILQFLLHVFGSILLLHRIFRAWKFL